MMMHRGEVRTLIVCLLLLAVTMAGPAWAQVNAVDLSGQLTDPQGAAVAGAKVTVKNLATNVSRTTVTGDDGRYTIVGLPPGRYEFTAEKSGFAKVVDPELVLTIGQAADLDLRLQLQTGTQTITVTDAAELVETRRTAVSETVDTRQIDNLPINGRNYVNFTLINSQANRDTAPSIGAAPTSGLNFGGQRARSNQVSVDGADAVDNSVNGIRSTVSQEAVQEFQLIISNYMPEFGRATGGVINIVTKGGSNVVHGNLFGFLRHSSLQARNPFSVQVNPATGSVVGVKQAYTRAQYGATIGGPIKKDKSFYFFAYEGTHRHETGFTNIGTGNFGLDPATGLTPQQLAYVTNPGVPAGVRNAYAALAGSATSVALKGIDPGLISMAGPGARFPLPVACTPNTLPPASPIPCGATGRGLAPLPASFVTLTSLIGNYPVKEATSLWSGRIDQNWNPQNSTFLRVNVSPSLVTGIQVNAQNQNFGQNAGTRTSLNQYRDVAVATQHVTSISNTLLNEVRFQFARRGLHYGFSQLPGGDQIAVNIPGVAFFGREPFSTVDRIERRWQMTDNVTKIGGKHTIKFGADINLVQVRSKVKQIFQLDFGGLYNFGSIGADAIVSALVGAPVTGTPRLTAVQAYGLGLPQVFLQGVGVAGAPFDNPTLGLFVQDSWRFSRVLTVNYGVRYDYEHTPLFIPSTGPGNNVAAEKTLGVVEGIPRYKKGVSPRLAIGWDPWGDGKTVVRAGYGIFYDHPLLAIAFNSTTADGARSTQLLAGGDLPSAVPAVSNPIATFNAGTLFQGVLNTVGVPAPFTLPYNAAHQRFDPFDPNSILINQRFLAVGFPLPLLPFTFPVAGNFRYAYAQQANLTLERSLGKDFKISGSYQFTKGNRLNRARTINQSNQTLLVNNFRNALASGLTPSSPFAVAAPNGAPGSMVTPNAAACTMTIIAPQALSVISSCPGPPNPLVGQFVGSAAFFNFFRPFGPNPSFAGAAGGYANQLALAVAGGYPVGKGGVPIPYSDVDQQESSGKSQYHGLTVNLTKRFSNHFQFLASYTWSHAIDNSTDLQSLLEPQDNLRPDLERSNSSFDQRHRFVLSGVFESPYKWGDRGWKRVLGDWVVAPIFEASSGRPFTVLTGVDYNVNFSSNTDRPSVVPAGTPGAVQSPFIKGVNFFVPTVCPVTIAGISPPIGCTGNIGRNTFTRPNFIEMDLRLSRKFHINDRFAIEVLADSFNLFNRFNVGDVNPLCDPATVCRAGEPTAAIDPRQFQFGLKLTF